MKKPDLKKITSYKVLRIVLFVFLILAIIIILTVPFFVESYIFLLYTPYLWGNKLVMLKIFLIMVVAIGIWILCELIYMTGSINKNPFTKQNVKSLKRVGLAAIMASLLFVIKFILIGYSIASIFAVIILLIGSLFAFTLSELFNRAVEIQDENELTI